MQAMTKRYQKVPPPPHPLIKKRHARKAYRLLGRLWCVVLAFVLAVPAGCTAADDGAAATAVDAPPALAYSAAYNMRFASFNNYERTTANAVKAYTVAADGSNIANLNQFNDSEDTAYGSFNSGYYSGQYKGDRLSEGEFSRLFENGFVISDLSVGGYLGGRDEHWELYARNKERYVPSFITTDATVHTYRLLFDSLLREVEEDYLLGRLKDLSMDMMAASQRQYQRLRGTGFEDAALRNVAFFSVGAKLADNGFVVPAEAGELAGQELALIDAAGAVAPSPVINYGQGDEGAASAEMLDYSQFAPRAHYTRTPALEAYWRATKWYGTATFRSSQAEEVKSALLLCNALLQDDNQQQWHAIFDTVNFFVGECDDITFYQYLMGTKGVYGESGLADLATVADADSFARASELIAAMPPPRINSLGSNGQKDAAGLRFLGERFVIDSAVLQMLTGDNVPGRGLPAALDIPAAFGSSEAVAILEGEGVMQAYPGYAGKLKEAQDYFADVTGDGTAESGAPTAADVWTSNLYWSWLYMLQPLVDNDDPGGLPSFMATQAWARKELNTFEGSWTELRHDTEAYSKSVESGRGAYAPPLPPPDDRGYVEPNPLLFGRLASLCQMTIDGLAARSMLSEDSRASLERLRYVADTCAVISEKELSDSALSDAEYQFIRDFGGELIGIWKTARTEDFQGMPPPDYLSKHPAGIITSVADDAAKGLALEEATGYPHRIYVVFPRDGELVIGSGTVYSQYEFTVASSERMTDEQWHHQLLFKTNPGSADYYYGGPPDKVMAFPTLAPWKASYMAGV